MKSLAPQIIQLLADCRKTLIKNFLDDIKQAAIFNGQKIHTTTNEEYFRRFGDNFFDNQVEINKYFDNFFSHAANLESFNSEFLTSQKYDSSGFDTSQQGYSFKPQAEEVLWIIKTSDSILKKIFANPPADFDFLEYNLSEDFKDLLRTTVLMDDFYERNTATVFEDNDSKENKIDKFSEYLAEIYKKMSENGKEVVEIKFKLALSGYSDVTVVVKDIIQVPSTNNLQKYEFVTIYKEFRLNGGKTIATRELEAPQYDKRKDYLVEASQIISVIDFEDFTQVADIISFLRSGEEVSKNELNQAIKKAFTEKRFHDKDIQQLLVALDTTKNGCVKLRRKSVNLLKGTGISATHLIKIANNFNSSLGVSKKMFSVGSIFQDGKDAEIIIQKTANILQSKYQYNQIQIDNFKQTCVQSFMKKPV